MDCFWVFRGGGRGEGVVWGSLFDFFAWFDSLPNTER